MRKWILPLALFTILCTVLLGLFILKPHPSTPAPQASASYGSPQYWKVQKDHMTIKNSHVVFAVKSIDITSNEIRIFYAIHVRGKTTLRAFSMMPRQEKVAMQVQDQVLGQVDSYRVGVLHVQRQDQVNQFITLQVQEQSFAWTLTPLEQKVVDRGLSAGTIIFVDQNQLPDATMNGPVTTRDHQEVAFFKATPDHTPAGYKA